MAVPTLTWIRPSISVRISRETSLSSTTSTRRPARSWPATDTSARRLAWASGAIFRLRVQHRVLPMPGCEASTQMRPPMSSTRLRLMASPRPVPPKRRVVDWSAWLNFSNRRSWTSGGMPMPVSRTQTCISSRVSLVSRQRKASSISPRAVNLTALPQRLSRIWPRRRGSPTRMRGREASYRTRNSRPFCSAWGAMASVRCSMTPSRPNSISSSSILPASTLEKSRMSLMIPSRAWAAPWALMIWVRTAGGSSALSAR